VQAPKVEVRASPVRVQAPIVKVHTSPVKVQAPIVKVHTSPVRANVKVEAPKIEVKADLSMNCWNCGSHNLKLMSIADLNKLNGSAKTSVSASVSAPRLAGDANLVYAPKVAVKAAAPRVEVRAEPARSSSAIGFSVKVPQVRVEAPRVEVRAEPVRANADFGFKAEAKAPQV